MSITNDPKASTNQRPVRKANSLELLPYVSFKDSFENLEANQEIISSFTPSVIELIFSVIELIFSDQDIENRFRFSCFH